jgi:hypothetical protein
MQRRLVDVILDVEEAFVRGQLDDGVNIFVTAEYYAEVQLSVRRTKMSV